MPSVVNTSLIAHCFICSNLLGILRPTVIRDLIGVSHFMHNRSAKKTITSPTERRGANTNRPVWPSCCISCSQTRIISHFSIYIGSINAIVLYGLINRFLTFPPTEMISYLLFFCRRWGPIGTSHVALDRVRPSTTSATCTPTHRRGLARRIRLTRFGIRCLGHRWLYHLHEGYARTLGGAHSRVGDAAGAAVGGAGGSSAS